MQMRIQWSNNLKVLKSKNNNKIKTTKNPNWLRWKYLSKIKVKYPFDYTKGKITYQQQTLTLRNVKGSLLGTRRMTLEGDMDWHTGMKKYCCLYSQATLFMQKIQRISLWIQWNLQEKLQEQLSSQRYMIKDKIQKFIIIYILVTNSEDLKFYSSTI